MTLYTATLEKRLQGGNGEKWSNVYHVNAANILDAQGIADDIADLEASILKTFAAIVRIAVANPAVPGSSSSRSVFVEGTVTGSIDDMLPMFNTVYYALKPAGGRPSPKYLRLPLTQGEVSGIDVTEAVTNAISTNYAAPLIALAGVVDEDGQPFIGYDHKQNVQMRQLGWHRRTRPGFHRGWVAD